MKIQVSPLPAFSDNYIWLINGVGSQEACVVDPGDATPVLEALQARGLILTSILITHHHSDHIGGVADLLAHNPHARVIGPDSRLIDHISIPVVDGDTIELFGCSCKVLAVPGHTLDHVAYVMLAGGNDTLSSQPLLFCGDTMFAGGCGRLYEGDPETMYASLQKLASLPGGTLVYCAHEYTLANLIFAMHVEPDNIETARRLELVKSARGAGLATIPSTIEVELRTNPFLRCHTLSVQRSAAVRDPACTGDDAAVFATVRRWKDSFRA